MTIGAKISEFLRDEDGSATVEWVMGTALGVTMALSVAGAVSDGVEALANTVSSTIAAVETNTAW